MRRFFGGRSTKFKHSDLVRLDESAPYPHLPIGSIGVVTTVYSGQNPCYEIEFLDARGGVLDRLVVKEIHLSGVEDT